MENEKYKSLFNNLVMTFDSHMYRNSQHIVTQVIRPFEEAFLSELEKDLSERSQKPKCPTIGLKHFLKTFYLAFGVTQYDGFLYKIKERIGYKSTEAMRKNVLKLAQLGYMMVHLEKKPFVMHGLACEAWMGRLQITEKGEKAAKELI